MIEFTIYGIIRGGKNHVNITRSGHRYPNKKWAKWRDQVVLELGLYLIENSISVIQEPVRMDVDHWSGDLKRRDLPAMVDSIFHCMELAKVIIDDALVKTLVWNWRGLDRANPRTVIRIEKL